MWIPLLQIKTFLLCFLRDPDRGICQFHRSSPPQRRFFLREGTSAVSLASLRHLLAFAQHFFPPPSTPREPSTASSVLHKSKAVPGERVNVSPSLLLELLSQCSGACKNIEFKHTIHPTKIMATEPHFEMKILGL